MSINVIGCIISNRQKMPFLMIADLRNINLMHKKPNERGEV